MEYIDTEFASIMKAVELRELVKEHRGQKDRLWEPEIEQEHDDWFNDDVVIDTGAEDNAVCPSLPTENQSTCKNSQSSLRAYHHTDLDSFELCIIEQKIYGVRPDDFWVGTSVSRMHFSLPL